jgi:hypothetical protein
MLAAGRWPSSWQHRELEFIETAAGAHAWWGACGLFRGDNS